MYAKYLKHDMPIIGSGPLLQISSLLWFAHGITYIGSLVPALKIKAGNKLLKINRFEHAWRLL